MSEDLSDIRTMKEAARILRCSLKSVYVYRDKGLLRTWRRGGMHSIVTSLTAIREFLQPEQAEPAYCPAPDHDLEELRRRHN